MATIVSHERMLHNPLYEEDLDAAALSCNWRKLDGKTVGITGATGMIGTLLVDTLMRKRRMDGIDVRVLALGRNAERAKSRLPYFGNEGFCFEEVDVSVPGVQPVGVADVWFHLASVTHPQGYATMPIETIMANVVGLQNVLTWASEHQGSPSKVLFASSVEVYGQNRGDVDSFAEDYCGYIDSNTLRAGYPEAKRLGEALCQAWIAEKGVQCWIPRLPRIYGPTVLSSDTKALSQFIGKSVAGQNIVLKSAGTQVFSYLYVADAVAGLLHVLTRCEPGIAYNLADQRSDVSLRDLADMLAEIAGTEVVFELPDEVERKGYSTASRAVLDGSRCAATGWRATYTIKDGTARTVALLREMMPS